MSSFRVVGNSQPVTTLLGPVGLGAKRIRDVKKRQDGHSALTG